MKVRIPFLAIGFVAGSLLCPAEASRLMTPASTSTETLSVDVGAARRIVVRSAAGSVELSDDVAGKVEVVATKTGPTASDASAIQVSLKADGQDIALTWKGPGGDPSNRSVDFRVRLPKKLDIDLDLGAGNIKLAGSTGDKKLVTAAGKIEVSGGSGKSDASTGGGDIQIREIQGTVTAATIAGGIRLGGSLSGPNTLKTKAGAVVVEIPAGSRLKVKLTTGVGPIANDFGIPVSGLAGHSATGVLGDGSEGDLSAHSEAGSIALRKKP